MIPPLRSRRAVFLAAFLPSLTAYGLTLHPSVPAGDSGELITAAATFGVAHPPGYPLYVVAGWSWIHLLPFGEVAWRMNLLSAVAGAVAAGVLALVAFRLTRSFAGALVAGWSVALSAPLWKYAVVAEVFAPNALLGALALLAFVAAAGVPSLERRMARGAAWKAPQARKAVREGTVGGSGFAATDTRALAALAFLSTLLLSLHHTLVLLIGPMLVVLVLQRAGPRSLRRRFGGPTRSLDGRGRAWVALAAIAGLAPLVIPPLVAHLPGAQVWGDPASLRGFLRLLARADYGSFRLDPVAAGMQADRSHIAIFLEALPRAVGPVALLLAAVGLVEALRRHPALALAIVGFALAQAAFFTRVGFPSTVPVLLGAVERFYILPIVVIGLLAGIGAVSMVRATRQRWVGYVLAASVLAWPLGMHARLVDQSRNRFAEHLGEALLAALPPRAVLFVQGDLQHNALLYLTRVRRQRPDVTVIDQELLTYDWYARRVQRVSPGILPALGIAQRIRITGGRAVEGVALPRGDGRVDLLLEDGSTTVDSTTIETAETVAADEVATMFERTRAAFRNSWLVPASDDRYSGLPGTRNLLWLEHLRGRRPVAFFGFKDDSWALRWELVPTGLVAVAYPRGETPPVAAQVDQSLRALAATALDDYFLAYDPLSFESAERSRLAGVATRVALLLCQPVAPHADPDSAAADTATISRGRAVLADFARRFEPLDPTPDPECLRALGFLHKHSEAFRDLALSRRLIERYLATGATGPEADEARRLLAGLADAEPSEVMRPRR